MHESSLETDVGTKYTGAPTKNFLWVKVGASTSRWLGVAPEFKRRVGRAEFGDVTGLTRLLENSMDDVSCDR